MASLIFDQIYCINLMGSPKIAVVILNWNGKGFLSKFLPSVLATSYNGHEVIIVDNGSTDGSVEFLKENFPNLRIIQFENNLGFAGGYNKALREIEAKYYVLLNSDVEVYPGWLDPMAELLDSDETIAACQPKVMSHANRKFFEYSGAAGGWLDKYGYPFAKGRIFDICEEDKGQYDQQEEIFWASGAALFIRSDVFHKAGGFDEYFFAHQEEIDLCWRIQLLGYRIFSCPASEVYHVGGGTLPRGNTRKTYLNFRNNKIMLSKNLPLRKKLWVMPMRNLLDAISAWKGLLTGDGGYFIAIVRAHMAFFKWYLFFRKRSVFPSDKNRKPAGMLEKNIAWLHFVRKKKTFSEIVGRRE